MGTLAAFGIEEVILQDAKTGEQWGIQRSALEKVEISVKRERLTVRGLALGAVVGGSLGLAGYHLSNDECDPSVNWCDTWSKPNAGVSVVTGMLGGGVLGGLVGALVVTDSWEEVGLGDPTPGVRTFVYRDPAGRPGFGLSLPRRR